MRISAPRALGELKHRRLANRTLDVGNGIEHLYTV